MAEVQETPPRRVAVTALFDESVVAELDAVAVAARTSRSEVLRRLVRQCLEEANGGGDEEWLHITHRMLLADDGPDDGGLHDDPEAMGATRIEW